MQTGGVVVEKNMKRRMQLKARLDKLQEKIESRYQQSSINHEYQFRRSYTGTHIAKRGLKPKFKNIIKIKEDDDEESKDRVHTLPDQSINGDGVESMVGSMLPITPGMNLMTPSQIALRKPSIKQYSGLIPRPASIGNQMNMTGSTPYNPTPYNPTPALSIKLNPNQ